MDVDEDISDGSFVGGFILGGPGRGMMICTGPQDLVRREWYEKGIEQCSRCQSRAS